MSENITPAEPERIEIQHVLISFAGTGTKARRSKDEAAALAAETLARANAGEDFDTLVRDLTDDSAPGIYRLANLGVAPAGRNEYPRNRMVAAFGDVGFGLGVGDIGVADFDPRTSPYGWHIIKRLS
ncbi:MAG: peptidylprolyl isomerase [Thermomicrobiales bacterium]